jgi:hypothetical protein
MAQGRDPIFGGPDLPEPIDNLIVPERPDLPEIRVPPNVPTPIEGPLNVFRASLDRIEKKLDDIDNRLKKIEGRL